MNIPAYSRPTESQKLEADLFVSYFLMNVSYGFCKYCLSLCPVSYVFSSTFTWHFVQGLCDMLIDRHEKGNSEENKAIVLSDIEVKIPLC